MEQDANVHLPAIRETIATSDGSITLCLKPTSDVAKVMEGLSTCCRSFRKVELVGRAVWIATGIHLHYVRERKLFKDMGFKSFNRFIAEHVEKKLGVKRSTAFKMARSAKAFAMVAPVKELKDIPIINLDTAARVAIRNNMDNRATLALLKEAREQTPERFTAEHAADSHGGSGVSVIRIVVHSKALMRRWQTWLDGREPEQAIKEIIEGRRLTRSVAA